MLGGRGRRELYSLERGFSVLGSDLGSGEVLFGSADVAGSAVLAGSLDGSLVDSGSGVDVASGSGETSLVGSGTAGSEIVVGSGSETLVGSGSDTLVGSGSAVDGSGSLLGSLVGSGVVVDSSIFLFRLKLPNFIQV
jgi:hypothetical protein